MSQWERHKFQLVLDSLYVFLFLIKSLMAIHCSEEKNLTICLNVRAEMSWNASVIFNAFFYDNQIISGFQVPCELHIFSGFWWVDERHFLKKNDQRGYRAI